MISIQIYPTTPELLEHLAPATLELANSAVEQYGLFVMALAGGSTPEKFYRLLSDRGWKKRFPWKKTLFFWGDERAVGPAHKESNYHMAMESLLSRAPVPKDHIIRMRGEAAELNHAAEEYEASVRSALESRRLKFDLILLGMGDDGHTASLFPGSPAETERERLVVAHSPGDSAAGRLTFTFPLINLARSVFLLVTGEHKAGIVKRVFTGTGDYPVRRVMPVDGQLTWWMDRAAAADISKTAMDGYVGRYQAAVSKV